MRGMHTEFWKDSSLLWLPKLSCFASSVLNSYTGHTMCLKSTKGRDMALPRQFRCCTLRFAAAAVTSA